MVRRRDVMVRDESWCWLAVAVLLSAVCSGCSSDPERNPDSSLRDAALSDRSTSQEGLPGSDALAGDSSLADLAPADTQQADLQPDLLPSDTIPAPDSNGLSELPVFILAGQSNMVGLGYNSLLSSSEATNVPQATIYYNDSVHPNTNAETWLPLGPGFGVTETRFGPELGFGHRLRQLWPNRPFAVIKVAEGATSLESDWTAHTGRLYQLLISEVQAQLAVLAQSWQPRLLGLVWMQGESDGMSLEAATAYQGRLSDFLSAVRQDLGASSLPVVAGLIAPHPNWPYAELVRQGTAALVPLLSPMEVVETNDLPKDPADTYHYDTQGSLTLGRRFAEAAAAIYASEWHFAEDFGANQYHWGWSYRERLGSQTQPMVFDSAQNRWAGSENALLIGPGWMHPGPSRSAELVWRAPRDGLMQVSLQVGAGDNGGGDGTVVALDHDAQTLWGPQAVPNNSQTSHQLQLLVQKGEELRFRTSSGPAGDNTYDKTLWQVDLTYAQP